MNKRGQFFLVAAFAIISVILGLGVTYNSAEVQPSDNHDFLVKDIKSEGIYLINQNIVNSISNFDNSLKNLVSAYSSNYPQYTITIIYGSKDNSHFDYLQYQNGQQIPAPAPPNVIITQPSSTPSNSNLAVSLNNRDYIFTMTKGYNLFVITEKRSDNEIFVSTA